MEPKDFIEACVKRAANSSDLTRIMHRLQTQEIVTLLHGVLGLETESAEVADLLKKYLYYGKDIETIKILDELGDVLWYVAIILDHFGWSFEECMAANDRKLEARYGNKFGETQAKNRDLEKERKALEE